MTAFNFTAVAALQSLHQSIVIRKEQSQKVKFSMYLSIYVYTFTYGHELWVMTGKMYCSGYSLTKRLWSESWLGPFCVFAEHSGLLPQSKIPVS